MMDHGALTDLVLAHLVAGMTANPDVTAGHVPPVGDGIAPAEGGWLEGQPNAGLFVPYVVLVSNGAVPRALSQNTSVPAWGVGFTLRSHGGSRTQCDWIATVSRRAVLGLKQSLFGDPGWKIINTEWVALGPLIRNDATAPPSWSVSDTVVFVCDGQATP